MVDSREAEVGLVVKVEDLTVLCKIRENINERMMIKERLSGKVVILAEEVLVLTEEEVILILEVVFVKIILDVEKKGIDLLNVDLLKVGKIIEMLCFKRTLRVHQVDLNLIREVMRNLSLKEIFSRPDVR